jgi:hypothetical protein
MKNFKCTCGNTVYFDNTHCISCHQRLAYHPFQGTMVSLQSVDTDAGTGIAADGTAYKLCSNDVDYGVCNWLITTVGNRYCISCGLNHMIPNLLVPDRRDWWSSMEHAKRKLLYTLLALDLPVVNKSIDPQGGLAFEFLEDKSSNPQVENEVVNTGHKNERITVNIAEADHAKREEVRQSMGESYRTLLGHFRHEIGHYYFWRLINTPQQQESFRSLFGDETQDYARAMETYYANRDTMERDRSLISHYAQSHPHEDWAECWAHYLHMIDTVETANEFGIVKLDNNVLYSEIDSVLNQWSELTILLNALNRSMGMADAYPFVLSELTIKKIRYVHSLICPN